MNRCVLRIVCLILCFILFPGVAFAVEGFRGSTWGDLRGELPKDGKENLILMGWTRQGIDWARWGNTTLNTYVTVRYRLDTERYDWNNSIGPGVGIAFDTYNPKGVFAMWGVEYLWDRYFESDRTEQKLVIYMGWYGWWDLKKR